MMGCDHGHMMLAGVSYLALLHHEEGFQRQSGSGGWKLYGLLEIANIAKADMSVPHFPLRP